MRKCCEKSWLGAIITAEGTIQVWKQGSRNMPTRAYGIRVMIYNSDQQLIDTCVDILNKLGVRHTINSRMTSKIGTKLIHEICVSELASAIKILEAVHPYLMGKEDFALAVLGLATARMQSREVRGLRAKWTDAERNLAEIIRKKYMPYRKRANGETLTDGMKPVLKAIPCQAEGSINSTSEGVETTATSNASSNSRHERPATLMKVEDIVRTTEKSVRGDKEPLEDIG